MYYLTIFNYFFDFVIKRYVLIVLFQVTSLKKQLKTESLGDGVSRAFLRALVQLIGGYRDALRFQPGEQVTFDEEKFIETRPMSLQPFLREMLHLQIFQQVRKITKYCRLQLNFIFFSYLFFILSYPFVYHRLIFFYPSFCIVLALFPFLPHLFYFETFLCVPPSFAQFCYYYYY